MKKLIQKLILRYFLRHGMFEYNGYVIRIFTKSFYDDVVAPELERELRRRNKNIW